MLVACGPAPQPPSVPKQKVGDLGVDIANLSRELPKFLDSIGAGDPKHDQVLCCGVARTGSRIASKR